MVAEDDGQRVGRLLVGEVGVVGDDPRQAPLVAAAGDPARKHGACGGIDGAVEAPGW